MPVRLSFLLGERSSELRGDVEDAKIVGCERVTEDQLWFPSSRERRLIVVRRSDILEDIVLLLPTSEVPRRNRR